MRILIHGINYTPELIGVGKYTGEMAEWLAARGHEVRMVTAPHYYPAWRIGDGFSAWRYQKECLNGVTVFRCPLWVPKKLNGPKRLIHLLSFALSSMPILISQVFNRPHVVLSIAPAFLATPVALLGARLSGAKAWLHIQDFEVDAAFALGILKMTTLRRAIRSLESLIIKRFDRVSTISNLMVKTLWRKGVSKTRSLLFLNWVDTEAICPLEGANPMRKELDIDSDTIVALYSGSMGQKQGIEILFDVAQKLKPHPKIKFVLCGQGSACSRIQSMVSDLTNVICIPLQPVERLNYLLNLADIHLLPQRADAADLVMPSKLTGILASGRPVVTTANPDTQVAQVVHNCGIVVNPEDADAFAESLLWLAEQPQERQRLGKAGRNFALKRLSKDKILSEFENGLQELVNR